MPLARIGHQPEGPRRTQLHSCAPAGPCATTPPITRPSSLQSNRKASAHANCSGTYADRADTTLGRPPSADELGHAGCSYRRGARFGAARAASGRSGARAAPLRVGLQGAPQRVAVGGDRRRPWRPTVLHLVAGLGRAGGSSSCVSTIRRAISLIERPSRSRIRRTFAYIAMVCTSPSQQSWNGRKHPSHFSASRTSASYAGWSFGWLRRADSQRMCRRRPLRTTSNSGPDVLVAATTGPGEAAGTVPRPA